MNHYTYLIKHKYSEMKYIGVRSCECNPEDDNYWGSSNYLPEDVSDVCEKIILKLFNTREEAMQHEIDLHNKYDVAVNEEYWNKAKATSTGFNRLGTTFKQTPEAIAKMKKGIKKRFDAGNVYRHTEESKTKISQANKGKKRSQEYIEYAREKATGVIFSEDRKRKMSESQVGKSKPKNTQCPYCGKIGDAGNMHRWHFNNCKKLGV